MFLLCKLISSTSRYLFVCHYVNLSSLYTILFLFLLFIYQYRSSHEHFLKGNHEVAISDMKRVKQVIDSVTPLESLLRAAVDIKLSSLLMKCGDLLGAEQMLSVYDLKGPNGPYVSQQIALCKVLQYQLHAAADIIQNVQNQTLATQDNELIASMYCLQVTEQAIFVIRCDVSDIIMILIIIIMLLMLLSIGFYLGL